jgi:Glutaredoxin-like domain (DUF836)
VNGVGKAECAAGAAGAASVARLLVYARAECHLCEEALAALEEAKPRLSAFTVVVCDIDAEEQLHDAYFERIPVIELDGAALCEYVFDEEAVSEALRRRESRR